MTTNLDNEIRGAVEAWTRDKDEYHVKMILYRNMLEDARIDTDHIAKMNRDEAISRLVRMHIADMDVFDGPNDL